MSARRTSKIWKIPEQELREIVAKNNSYKGILATFGLENKGENFKTLKKRLNEDHISYDHLLKHGQNLSIFQEPKSLKEILIINSTFNRGHLKGRLLKAGLLKNQCYECPLLNEWNGKPIVLQLDHINGISNDNRLENLRILCPNCHSQTHTFAGKRKSKK